MYPCKKSSSHGPCHFISSTLSDSSINCHVPMIESSSSCYLVAINGENVTFWAYPADKIYFWFVLWDLTFFLLFSFEGNRPSMRIFVGVFLFSWEKQDAHSCALKIKEECDPFGAKAEKNILQLWIGVYSAGCRLTRPVGSGKGNPVVIFLSWTAKKHTRRRSASCVAEEEEKEKRRRWRRRRSRRRRQSLIIQMKWGPADGGRGAVGIRRNTSCSLPLWFQSAHDKIRVQRESAIVTDLISIFPMSNIRRGGVGGCIPCRN